MKTLNPKTLETIKAAAAESVHALEEGKDIREIAKEIYCTLTDKSEEIGYKMADHFAVLIEEYHSHVDSCIENEDMFIDEQLAIAVKGRTPAEACMVYHRMLLAITAGAIINQANPADAAAVNAAKEEARRYIEAQEDMKLNDGPEAEKKASELAVAVKQSLKESKLVSAQLPQLLMNMQDETLETTEIVPAFGRKSKDLKLLLAMQAYVNAKNGSLEDIDPNISMRDITFMTCGSVDTCAVAAELEEGNIAEDTAEKIMNAIGFVVGTVLVITITFFLTTAIIDFYVSLFSVSSLAGLLFSVLAAVLVVEEVMSDRVVKIIQSIGIIMARTAGFALGRVTGLLTRGLQKLAAMMKAGTEMVVGIIKERVARIHTGLTENTAVFETAEGSVIEETETAREKESAGRQQINMHEPVRT